ncbi:MAG TPA: hypothetical protein VN982_04225 [Candidatus Dormibacteraeota bacterium]|nr:hypothetical protein [Candidatus Dormibacteraeota bacterium]
MTKRERGTTPVQVIWAVAGLLVIVLAAYHIFRIIHKSSVKFTTRYQAVLFSNGSVYFGHLEGYGTHNPVLTDVFYVLSQTNPETKQVTNSLVKRGKEPHEPDRMYLNPNQIVFVESVGANSKVAQLMAQQPAH